jgi:hypothetical protein
MIQIPEKTLAFRNNNPGNLRFAGQRGASEGEGGFARFETAEEGFNALVRQVELDTKRGHTVESFINKYAPPVENDTNNYIAFLEKQTGVNRSQALNEVDRLALAKAMAKLESGASFMEDDQETETDIAPGVPVPEVAEPSAPEKKEVAPDRGDPANSEVEPMTLENLPSLLEAGLISEDQAMDFLTRKEMEGHLFDMTPEGAEDAWKRGYLTDEQMDLYLDRKESPTWFYTKDILKAPIKGIENAVESTANAVNELLGLSQFLGKAEIPDYIDETHTIPGNLVSALTQFGVPYAGVSKAVTAVGLVQKVMSTSKMLQFSAAYPKLVPLMESLIHGTAAGAVADYAAFDPFEGRLVDTMDEMGCLPEFVDFMTTDPTNPAPVERLKNVLEGAVTGAAFETLFAALKGARAALRRKHLGDTDAIASETFNNPKVREAYNLIEEAEEAEATAARKQNVGKNAKGLQLMRDELALKENRTAAEEARLKFFQDKLDEIGYGKPGEEDFTVPKSEEAKPAAGDAKEAPKAGGKKDPLQHEPGDTTALKIFLKKQAGEVVHADFPESEVVDKACDAVEKWNGSSVGDLFRTIAGLDKTLIDQASGGPLKKRTTPGGGHYWSRKTHFGIDQSSKKLIKETMTLYGRSEKDVLNSLSDMVRDTHIGMQELTEKVRACNVFVASYADDVARKIDEAVTFEEKLAALEHIKLLEELEARVFGMRSESGRLTNSYNMRWMKGRFDFGKLPAEIVDDIRVRSEKQVDDALKHYKTAKNTRQRIFRARNLGKNRILGGLLEFVQLNLLYNPKTQFVNIGSQLAVYGWKTMHRAIGATLDAAIHRDASKFKEIGLWLEGTRQGFVDAFKLAKRDKKISLGEQIRKDPELGTFWKSIWTGDSYTDPMHKLEGEGTESFLGKMIEKLPGGIQPIGKLLRWPFHGLTAFDEAFKSVSYRAELYTSLAREGQRRGLKGKNLDLWFGSTVKQPPIDVHMEALRTARENTFQDLLDKFSGGMEKAFNSGNVGLALRIAAVPFYKITVNMAKYAARNSALAPISRQWRKEFAMGGVRRYEAVSRMLTGTAAMYVVWGEYEKGNITGRCPKELRPLWEAEGRQEYSIRWNGQWYSYKRLAPFGTIMAIACNAVQAWDYISLYEDNEIEGDELFFAGLACATDAFTSDLWVTSVKDLVDLLSGDSNMNPEKLGLKQVEKFIPGSAGLTAAQEAFRGDGILRTVMDIGDLWYKKVDTTKMTPRQHILYGTEAPKQPAGLGLLNATKIDNDPVIKEMVDIKCVIPRVEDEVTLKGQTVELTKEQYVELNRIIESMPLKETLNKVIQNPQYRRIQSPEKRAEILKKIVSEFRKNAKKILVSNDKALKQELIDKVREYGEDILGYHTDPDPAGRLYKFRKLMR